MSKLLITGGTGSFGNAAVKHFLNDPKISEIVIFSRDEKKQYDMFHFHNHSKLTFVIGDIRDKNSVMRVCRGVNLIFHAAALKHVPTGEFSPMEIVKTNILGTENLAEAAELNGVKKMVLLSTDKAVYPINAMGMSKALAEKIIGSHARHSRNTIFCSVRYGNVIATRGSVIPLFVDFIKRKKPILITDPLMTRFLLSLEDSIKLVDLAINRGKQGDLFIKKSPSSTIGDLTHALLTVFKAKNEVKTIGLRAGEKIHETLATQAEISSAQDLGDYYRINNSASQKYEEFYKKGKKIKIVDDYTSENTRRLTAPEVEKFLLSLDYIKQELKSKSLSKHVFSMYG